MEVKKKVLQPNIGYALLVVSGPNKVFFSELWNIEFDASY